MKLASTILAGLAGLNGKIDSFFRDRNLKIFNKMELAIGIDLETLLERLLIHSDFVTLKISQFHL